MKFTDFVIRHQGANAGLVARSGAVAGVLLLAGSLWGQSSPWVGGLSGSIYYNGNVGIGTANPAGNLQVAKLGGFAQLKVGDDSSSSSSGLNGFNFLPYSDGNNYFDSKTQPGGYTYFRTGQGFETGYTRFWMTVQASTGNVGMGTMTPSDKLEALGGNGSYIKSTALQSGTNNWAGFQIKSWVAEAADTWSLQGGSLTGSNTSTFAIADSNTGRFFIDSNGHVGIGMGYTGARPYTLSVRGSIGAEAVYTNSLVWSDYVFEPGYHLAPLEEVSAYIRQHHHLPDIPSAAEVKDMGFSVGDMQAKLLAKVEELTLHMIEAEKHSKQLEEENRNLAERVRHVETLQQPSMAEAPGKTDEAQ